MGFSGVSMGSLLVILLIVMVIFGTKRLRNIGEDLGAAVRGFREGMNESKESDQTPHASIKVHDDAAHSLNPKDTE